MATAFEVLPLLMFPLLASAAEVTTPPAAAIGDNSVLMGDVSSLSTVMRSPTLVSLHGDSSNPDRITGVELHGTMFAACAGKFQLTNTAIAGDDSTGNAKLGIGFKLNDPTGDGIACVKALGKQGCTTKVGAPNECITVSTHFGDAAVMDLSNYNCGTDKIDVKVGLIYTSANDLDGGAKFSPIPEKDTGNTIEFKNLAQIKAEAADLAKQQKQDRIDSNLARFTNCQDTLDHLPLSQKALAGLRADGYPISKYLEMQQQLETKKAQLIKALKLKDLAALHKRVKNVKSVDDADEINDDLTDFASNNSEYEKTIAAYKRELAKNVADLSDSDPAGFQKAHDIAADAAGMDGLTKAQQMAFKNDALKYNIAGIQAQAKVAASSGGNFGITPTTFYGLAEQARNLYTSSCSGKNGMSDSCSEAFQNAKAAVQIPQFYQQAVQQNQAFMAQFQSISQPTGTFGQNSQLSPNIFNSGMGQGSQGFGGQNIFNSGAGYNSGMSGSIFSNSAGLAGGGIRFQ